MWYETCIYLNVMFYLQLCPNVVAFNTINSYLQGSNYKIWRNQEKSFFFFFEYTT